MTDSPELTVFIVDDDPDLRDALAVLMQAAGLRAESFGSGREFLQRCGQGVAGCLVLDIRMPGMDGIALQAELHKRRIDLPIVFLTGHGDVPLAVRAMKAGACDFIQKPLDEHLLVIAVMNAQKVYLTQLQSQFRTAAGEVDSALLAALTGREKAVLQRMLAGQSSREMADGLSLSLKTIEFHRANIREKLGVASNHELIMRLASKPI